MLEGTVKVVLLLESDTANPPVGADPLNEIVHELVPGVLMIELAQVKLFKDPDTGRTIAPESPVEGMDVPSALVATSFARRMGIGLLPGSAAIWNVAIATTPSAITLLLNPITIQLFPAQEIDFPAFVLDAPGTSVMPVMSEEIPKDH